MTNPIRIPRPICISRAAKQHGDHVSPPPAQRDANAHLSRSLRGGEGEHRVDAGQRQKHDDERQGQEEPEEQRHGAGTCGSDLIEAGDLRDLKRGLDISGDGPQAWGEEQGIAHGMDGHADGITSARNQRVIDAGPPRVARSVFRIYAEIPHDAHDFMPRFVFGFRRILLCQVCCSEDAGRSGCCLRTPPARTTGSR